MRLDLVERAMNGDREAFGRLVVEDIDRLHAIARLILRDADLAEDSVQDALIRCWRQLPQLRDPAKFDAWLYRILLRAAADQYRSRRRFEANVRHVRVEPAEPDGSRAFADRQELERAFARLSLDHRAVVVLRDYVGFSMPEVAAALDIRLGTAKSRYHYALAALRAAIEAEARPLGQEGVPA